MEYTVTTFYKFVPLTPENIADIQRELEVRAASSSLLGLLLLAPEGVNATLAGKAEEITYLKEYLQEVFGELSFKDSPSDIQPFKRFKVSVRDEIVQLKRTDIQPGNQSHVSPEEWDRLVEQEDAVLIDVRNWYETKLGSFTGALDPKTETFSEFPEWVKKSDIPKSKPVAIFCTGGIRCEKAAVAMEELGYENVHQLDGGILNYIEKNPNKNFEGECFVFDHRVSVGQDLKPSQKYGRCPHCGNGGDLERTCIHCKQEYKACADCELVRPESICSKRCRNELARIRQQVVN